MILTTFLACMPTLGEVYETGWTTTDALDELEDEATAPEDKTDEEESDETDASEDEEPVDELCDVSLAETGDDVVDLGAPELPLVVCGDLGAVGNDGSSYTGDIDWIELAVAPGDIDLTLVPDEGDAVYDVWVYGLEDDAWVLVTVGLGDEGQAEVPLVAHHETRVLLGIIGWSGPSGGWSLEVVGG